MEERVVLVDDAGTPIGEADKRTVHGASTPLHLAFSCYLFNGDGEVLVTRRALGKLTWPGVWSNSFCGHPSPGEAIEDAVMRRASHELGLDITDLRLVLPTFRYRAVDAGGTVENEVCPVFTANAVGEPRPNPDEVAEFAWLSLAALTQAVDSAPFAFSPWMVMQIPLLGIDQGTREFAANAEGS